MAVRINNYSRSMGPRGSHNYYQWRIFVDEPPEVLDQIDEVEYLLHPTFPEPEQVRDDSTTRFAVDTAGWGTFEIPITIRYKDGHEEHQTYELDLDPSNKPWPTD